MSHEHHFIVALWTALALFGASLLGFLPRELAPALAATALVCLASLRRRRAARRSGRPRPPDRTP